MGGPPNLLLNIFDHTISSNIYLKDLSPSKVQLEGKVNLFYLPTTSYTQIKLENYFKYENKD